MVVAVIDTALMGSLFEINHHVSNLCIVRDGDEDSPVKLIFLAAPSRATDHQNCNLCLRSEAQDAQHAIRIACSQDTDSATCNHAGTLLAVADEHGVKKPNRPCKGKRNRYKKFVKRLQIQFLEDPSSFELETINLLPSLQRNDKQRPRLMQRMVNFMYQAKMCDVVEVNIGTLSCPSLCVRLDFHIAHRGARNSLALHLNTRGQKPWVRFSQFSVHVCTRVRAASLASVESTSQPVHMPDELCCRNSPCGVQT